FFCLLDSYIIALFCCVFFFFFFSTKEGNRDWSPSRGLGDVDKRPPLAHTVSYDYVDARNAITDTPLLRRAKQR
ncbi:hypothetical protein J4536_23595, partial [Escherichia coli]|nr:hypothetical protein [Escherichia coli]